MQNHLVDVNIEELVEAHDANIHEQRGNQGCCHRLDDGLRQRLRALSIRPPSLSDPLHARRLIPAALPPFPAARGVSHQACPLEDTLYWSSPVSPRALPLLPLTKRHHIFCHTKRPYNRIAAVRWYSPLVSVNP